MYMSKQKIIIVGLLVLFLLLGIMIHIHAQTSLGFGGNIIKVDVCANNGGVALTLGPPSPPGIGAYLFLPGPPNGPPVPGLFSVLYPYGQIYRPGPYVLGAYIPGGVCLSAGKVGIPVPVIGTITIVGTSL